MTGLNFVGENGLGQLELGYGSLVVFFTGNPPGKAGAAYLYEKRRLSKAVVTRFGLGVAPEGWDNLIRAMAEKGYDKRDLLDAGLAVGDRIVSVDDVMVSASTDVTSYLADKAVGDQVVLNVEREGRLVTVTVTLVENTTAE